MTDHYRRQEPDPLVALFSSVFRGLSNLGGLLNRWRFETSLLAVLLLAHHFLPLPVWLAALAVLLLPDTPGQLAGKPRTVYSVLITPGRIVRAGLFRARTRRRWAVATQGLGIRIAKITSVPAGAQLQVRARRGSHVAALQRADTLERVGADLGATVTVEPDRLDPGKGTVMIRDRDPFDTTEAIPWPDRDRPATDAWEPIKLGRDELGHTVLVPLISPKTGAEGMLVGGVAGSGKSVTMNVLIAHYALAPNCSLWLMDGKDRVEFGSWAPVADRLIGSRTRDAIAALKDLQAEMNARWARLEDLGVKHLQPEHGYAPIVLVIDELAIYLNGVGKDAATILRLLIDIRQRGRAAAIAMIAATQRPDAETIDTNLREAMTVRYGLRAMNGMSSDMVMGQGWATAGFNSAKIPRYQRGVGLLLAEGSQPERVKGFVLDDAGVQAITDRAIESGAQALLATPAGQAVTPEAGPAGGEGQAPE